MTSQTARPAPVEFVVRLRPLPGDDDPIRQLRGFLKSALRQWRLKAIDVQEITPAGVSAEANNVGGQ